MKKCHLVIGATGDVGQGIVRQLLRSGALVIAAARGADRLAMLQKAATSADRLKTVAGSVENEVSAVALRNTVRGITSRCDAVIVSVQARSGKTGLRDVASTALMDVLRMNLSSHFIAAKTFIPELPAGASYIAIGGGMADRAIPDYGLASICQAAQRAMLRTFDAELGKDGVRIRELMLHSMIAGASNRDSAHPNWITDEDVGRHIETMLAHPDAFPDTIVDLRSRQQVGTWPTPHP